MTGQHRTAVIIVGVGGQGSVFLARVLGEAALRQEVGVVASELHGMAQRGGAVLSTVVLGDAHGPIVPPGEGDVLIALEPLEALRALPTVKKGGTVILGSTPLVPFTVSQSGPPYPDLAYIQNKIDQWADQCIVLDLPGLARQAGEVRAVSAVALGAASAVGVLPLRDETVRGATMDLAPKGKEAVNGKAFDIGAEAAKAASRART